MQVKEVKLLDGSGGLNNRDQPSQIKINEFSKLENILTDEGGWPGKKRPGQLLMQYGPIDPITFRGVDEISVLSGAGPGLITITCASTTRLKVGMKLTFYAVGLGAVIEDNVVVSAVLTGTTFQVTNTVPFVILMKFKEAGTLHLLHMDDPTGATQTNDTVFEAGNPNAPTGTPSSLFAFSVPSSAGLLPAAAPLARDPKPMQSGPLFTDFGGYFRTGAANAFDGESSIFFESWVYINPSFTGAPQSVSFFGTPFVATNSGAHILATRPTGGFGGPGNLGEARNGLTIWRDWDAATSQDISDPYIKFQLITSNNGVTVLTSKYLPTSTWLFVRGSYIASIGKIRLRINGELHAEASATGTIDDDFGFGPAAIINWGGTEQVAFTPFFFGCPVALDGKLDEARIKINVTEAEEAIQPFKEPRGKPFPLVKANGTYQLIVGAGDGLYYTVGDGAWVQMNDAVHDVLGAELFSDVADWDASQIFDGLFLQNGLDNPKLWDGAKLYPWGEAVTPLMLARVAAGAGIGFIGSVSYYQTFLFGDQETGPGPIATVALTALTDQVDITNIPLGAPGCTGRKIYRIKATGPDAGKIYLLRQINDNIATSLTGVFVNNADPNLDINRDGLPDATLGTLGYVEMTAAVRFTKVPKAKYTLANQNRAWLAGNPDDQYSAYYSERDTPHVFLPVNFVQAASDSGPLIGLAKYYGETHASKGGKATLVLRGDNPSNWQQFEVLHPTIGSVDHWSYVHRTIPQSDSYRLCFWGQDGAYAYAGQDFEKISDIITGTTAGLIVDNGNKLAVTVTTRNEWEAAPGQGGSITLNAYAPTYEQDGTREFPGQLRSVDQLDYISLSRAPSGPIPGKPLAIAKAPNEGEFFVASDTGNELYYITNNFVSSAIVAGSIVPPGHKIIEIVRNGNDYFLITSGTGLTAGLGMHVYKFSHAGAGIGVWSAVYTVGDIFPVSDTFFRYSSDSNVPTQSIFGLTDGLIAGIDPTAPEAKGFHIMGRPAQLVSVLNNAYSDHVQNAQISMNQVNGRATALSSTGLTDLAIPITSLNITHLTFLPMLVGFHAVRDSAAQILKSTNPAGPKGFAYYPLAGTDTNGFRFEFTHRENPYYSGGTFRPQTYWDTTNSVLVFVAGDPEDVNGRIRTTIYKLTDGAPGVLTALVTNNQGTYVIADSGGGIAYVVQTIYSPTNSGPLAQIYTLNIGTTTYTPVGAGSYGGIVPLRLAFNSNSTVGANRLLLTAKEFNEGSKNSFNFSGGIFNINVTSGLFTKIKSFSAGSVTAPHTTPIEIAVQTNAPYAYHVAVKDFFAADAAFVGSVDKEGAAFTIYKTAGYNNSAGVRSNILFVEQSGAAGGLLWADRLYFGQEDSVVSGKMIQLGVPGTWKVRINYVSSAFLTSGFAAFDSFDTDFQGLIYFYLRNAATLGALAASEQAVTPNQNIPGFPNPDSIFQFRISFDWNYSVAAPTTSPYVDFVQIGYFSDSANLPRVVGWQWKGRTFWSVAEVGQTKNNLVVVYQKDNKWTTYTGWSIKGTAEFLGKLVALQDFSLVQIEVGPKDLGNLIRTKSRTGYIMDGTEDKCIRDFNFNLLSYVNNNFPTKPGYMKIVPYAADTRLPADWLFEIPAAPTVEPRQVVGFHNQATFPFQYARALAIECLTSDDTGTYAPTVDQVESMAGLILNLFVSSPRILAVRK